jgi:hypothetical protein
MIFPMLMRDNCSVFNYKNCCFQIQKEKEGCARICLWRELLLTNCYTLEISFCGADNGKYEYFHFNLENFKEITEEFFQSIIGTLPLNRLLRARPVQGQTPPRGDRTDAAQKRQARGQGALRRRQVPIPFNSDSNYSNEEKYNEIINDDKNGFDNTQKKFKKAVRIANLIKKKK